MSWRWTTFAQLPLLFVLVSAALPSLVRADAYWPQWRGPGMNGVAAGKGFPVKWSTDENVLWKYELPGVSASTPAVWREQIILSGESGGKNSVLCLDLQGQKQWEVTLDDTVTARNRGASGSNPSPATDGEYIFAYFKSGTLTGLDMQGKVLWQKNLQKLYGRDTLWWDLGTSPVLTKDSVVVACMQSDNSYLVAFEKASGKVAWKQDRNLDAPGESAQSYTTPVVVSRGDQELVITLGADHVTAHDAATGKQVWIAGNFNPDGQRNWRSIASPVVAGDLLIAPYARGRTLTAIQLGGQGDVTNTHVVWEQGPSADVPSPVAADDKVYVCTDRGRVIVVDVKTGKPLSEQSLPRSRSSFWSSPIIADGHLYATNQDGTTFVLKLGSELRLVAENRLEDYTVATPVFLDGRVYIRTDKYLFCIGTK